MFTHWFAGALVFLIGGYFLGLNINREFLVAGSFWGFFPDLLSLLYGKVRLDGQCHKHRENFSHTIFFPVLFLAVGFLTKNQQLTLSGCAMLTHPLIDSVGIGWGVMLFWPFSRMVFKPFYKKDRAFYSADEMAEESRQYGMDDWIKRVYLTFNPVGLSRWWGIFEWICLFAFIMLLVLY
ncbi:MAG: metal-dependent hydrolase [Patescibacteria group bacterium]|nr:metal-dependent hydrolase [Patescibacteria group bacterium]MDD4610916.1 metal-dependent hydrolase [Patescibacteria group bacterium]